MHKGDLFRSVNGRYIKGIAHGNKHRLWKGGDPWLDKDGYKIIYVPGLGRVREHRYILENKIERKLLSSEHSHHINGDITDNRPENLEVMINSEHMKMHRLKERNGRWSRHYNECLQCQRIEIPHAQYGFCRTCFQRFVRHGEANSLNGYRHSKETKLKMKTSMKLAMKIKWGLK